MNVGRVGYVAVGDLGSGDDPPGTHGLRHYGGALTDIRPMNARPFYAMRALASKEDGSTEP